jgi:hypothetical protein
LGLAAGVADDARRRGEGIAGRSAGESGWRQRYAFEAERSFQDKDFSATRRRHSFRHGRAAYLRAQIGGAATVSIIDKEE